MLCSSEYRKRGVLTLLFLAVCVWQNVAPAQSNRPFRRVLVCQGAGMTPGVAFGMYDAACDAGKKPDLIISTCGSSLSAAAIGAYPDRRERMEFLGSPDHHSMYLSATIRRPGVCNVLGRFATTRCRGRLRCLPDSSVFDTPVMEVPLRPRGSHHIHRPFPTEDGVPRIIMLASELSYCPNCEPRTKEDGKYCRVTYFTDADTARHLYGRPSDMAHLYPESTIEPMTQVKLGHTMGDAARASISDPYYINLTHLDGRYFATGAVNLHPIELAQSLADEVIFAYYYPACDPLGQSGWGTFFGYDIRKRGEYVTQQWATHWVDFSDFTRLGPEFKFDPKMSRNPSYLKCFSTAQEESDVSCFCPVRVETGVPESLAGFRAKLERQYYYGYRRTMESFQQPAGSQAHIRIPNGREMIKSKIRSPKVSDLWAR